MINNSNSKDQEQELTVSANLTEGFVFAMVRRIRVGERHDYLHLELLAIYLKLWFSFFLTEI